VIYIKDELPHPYFELVMSLTNGDPTKHNAKWNELLKTPYIWVLTYLELMNSKK